MTGLRFSTTVAISAGLHIASFTAAALFMIWTTPSYRRDDSAVIEILSPREVSDVGTETATPPVAGASIDRATSQPKPIVPIEQPIVESVVASIPIQQLAQQVELAPIVKPFPS